MSRILGYIYGLPVLESREVAHAPAGTSNGGQFVSKGGGGGGGESKPEKAKKPKAEGEKPRSKRQTQEAHEHHDAHGNVLSKEPHKQLSEHFGRPVSMHDLAQAFSGGSHFKVSIEKIDFDSERVKGYGGFEVVGVVHDHGTAAKDNKQAGRVKRVFSKDMHPDDGRDVHSVEHHVLDLPKHMQGKGGAKELLSNSQHFYDKHGVDKIELTAGLDIGRYAWARMGFTARSKDVDVYRKAFVQHLTDKGLHAEAVEAGKIKGMHQIADFKSADGHRHGKDFLIHAGNEDKGGPDLPRYKATVTRGKPDWKRYEAALDG